MCTVGHSERAAEMVAGFGKSFRRAGTEGDVLQVDLLGDAAGRGEAGNQTLDKFRKGTAANFIIYEAPGLGMPIKISLNGFAAAYVLEDNDAAGRKLRESFAANPLKA